MMAEYTGFLDVAKEAANQAGEILLEAWDKPRTVIHKGSVDLVRTTALQLREATKTSDDLEAGPCPLTPRVLAPSPFQEETRTS
jgi:hypothetical protein